LHFEAVAGGLYGLWEDVVGSWMVGGEEFVEAYDTLTYGIESLTSFLGTGEGDGDMRIEGGC
jgi:hypothetical protein